MPGLWALEVGHVLLTAERRGRISLTERQTALELLSILQIEIDTATASRAWSETLALAETHRLTLYDASYLEASIRLALPLASRDRERVRAAAACGVCILT